MPIQDSVQSENDVLKKIRPLVLLLIDGWGIGPKNEANPLSSAHCPFFSSLLEEYPVTVLKVGDYSLNSRYLSLGSGQDVENEDFKTEVTLSALVSAQNLKQIKITETERFTALSYFFNGAREEKYSGEDWKIISSSSNQKNLNHILAFKKTAKELIRTIEKNKQYSLIVSSWPFLTLISETNNFKKVQEGMELIDKKLRSLWGILAAKNGILIISSTGGGAENIFNPDSDLLSSDLKLNPVPLMVIGSEFKGKTIGLADPLNNDLSFLVPEGSLKDLAPSILKIMGLVPPPEMTGKSLL